MNIMRAFIGINRLKIHHMANNMKFISNTVTTMHITGDAGNF